jgi:hypothetical protein
MKCSMTGQKSDILEDCSVFGNLVITLISLTSDSILQPLCTLTEFKRSYLSFPGTRNLYYHNIIMLRLSCRSSGTLI